MCYVVYSYIISIQLYNITLFSSFHQVTAEAEGLFGNRRVTNTAYFTFVSLGKGLKAQAIPPLVLKNDEEKVRFEEGKQRYEKRKQLRMEKLQKLAAK